MLLQRWPFHQRLIIKIVLPSLDLFGGIQSILIGDRVGLRAVRGGVDILGAWGKNLAKMTAVFRDGRFSYVHTILLLRVAWLLWPVKGNCPWILSIVGWCSFLCLELDPNMLVFERFVLKSGFLLRLARPNLQMLCHLLVTIFRGTSRWHYITRSHQDSRGVLTDALVVLLALSTCHCYWVCHHFTLPFGKVDWTDNIIQGLLCTKDVSGLRVVNFLRSIIR